MEQLGTYAEEMGKYKMIAYAIADKEDVSVSQKEVIETLLSMTGADSEEAFEKSYGVTTEEYAKTFNSYGMKNSPCCLTLRFRKFTRDYRNKRSILLTGRPRVWPSRFSCHKSGTDSI